MFDVYFWCNFWCRDRRFRVERICAMAFLPRKGEQVLFGDNFHPYTVNALDHTTGSGKRACVEINLENERHEEPFSELSKDLIAEGWEIVWQESIDSA